MDCCYNTGRCDRPHTGIVTLQCIRQRRNVASKCFDVGVVQ